MEDFHQLFDDIKKESEARKVLASIVHVDGSAYKREGSSMIFFDDGKRFGSLSAGCLEEDLALYIKEVVENDEPKVIAYDLREESDLTWGEGIGCNGIIHILLEPLDQHGFDWIYQKLAKQTPVLLIRKLDNNYFPIQSYLLAADGETLYNNKEIDTYFLQILQQLHPFQNISGIKEWQGLPHPYYTHVIWPKPRLIVIGAGNDAKPLTKLAKEVGFSVCLCDWRPALCHKDNFPEVDTCMVGFPTELHHQLNVSPFDSVVLMTHSFIKDQELLTYLVGKELFYLGILGSQKRTERLLKEKDPPKNLHAPVGLSIGAQGAEEIAISILAEIIQKMRKSGDS